MSLNPLWDIPNPATCFKAVQNFRLQTKISSKVCRRMCPNETTTLLFFYDKMLDASMSPFHNLLKTLFDTLAMFSGTRNFIQFLSEDLEVVTTRTVVHIWPERRTNNISCTSSLQTIKDCKTGISFVQFSQINILTHFTVGATLKNGLIRMKDYKENPMYHVSLPTNGFMTHGSSYSAHSDWPTLWGRTILLTSVWWAYVQPNLQLHVAQRRGFCWCGR